jgi:uncharacterized repeat protein (TIGR03803 family)
MRSKKPFSAGNPTFLIFITLLLASAVAATQAGAQKFKVLHTFHGPNGASPWTQLTRDAEGNLYGTTESGGSGKCQGGCGTAFKLDKDGKQVRLHGFNGKNGRTPAAGLLRDAAGTLYGTTVEGGDTTCFSLGCGTVFKLDTSGRETVLHKFTGTNGDGFFPGALLVRDQAGNLYGTTANGGAHGFGTVFKLDRTGKETVLYSFTCESDGCTPYPGVVLDSSGNLYGAAFYGGIAFGNSGHGVVFKVDTSGSETVLHTFGGSDGANPDSVLLFDSGGNLYGTTQNGGNSECGGTGCGVVFELSPQSGGGWTETTLYRFCSQSNCTDGEDPIAGPLVRDSAGNLYGTTYFGGTYDDGVVFKLDTTGKETVLHNFSGRTDGANSPAGLVVDKAGNLYGSTFNGGDLNCTIGGAPGCGVVFKLTP